MFQAQSALVFQHTANRQYIEPSGFGSMERTRITVTFDLTLAALIILMMAYLADRLLRWYNYAVYAHQMLTAESQDFLCDHLVHLLTYFFTSVVLFAENRCNYSPGSRQSGPS